MGHKIIKKSKLAKKLGKQNHRQPYVLEKTFSLDLYNSGKMQEAELASADELKSNPAKPASLYVAGMIAIQRGQFQRALDFFTRTVTAAPKFSEAYFELGTTYNDLKMYDEAIKAFGKALTLGARGPLIFNNLATSHKELGETDKAIGYYKKALLIDPNFCLAHFNLGCTYHFCGQITKSIECFKKALASNQEYYKAWNNLSLIYYHLGEYEKAASCCKRSIEINNLDPAMHDRLAVILTRIGLPREAESSCQKALALDKDFAPAYNTLGTIYFSKGAATEAFACFRKSLALNPDQSTHSNLLFHLNYSADITQEQIYSESLRWNAMYGAKQPMAGAQNVKNRRKNRRIRIGYLSPDFCDHSVSYFIEPVLRWHDREKVKIYCYANVQKPDAVTQHLRSLADDWHDIWGLPDPKVLELVKGDGIDILIDLAGHSKANRLTLLAQQPAPAQITWLGYPNTTGLQAIGYRLTDAIADPPGVADTLHSEKLIRLPEGFLCYQPDSSAPPPGPSPCLENGHITFGSFNNIHKVSTAVVQLWIELLNSVADSHLVLKSHVFRDPENKARYMTIFETAGIAGDRIELIGWLQNKNEHLNLYQKIDVGLDPFPYNGTTTTCEALWMGVPVVTLRGNRHAGRVGASIMHHTGLDELVAESPEAYLALAVSLAKDPAKLTGWRRSLRGRMQQSSLMDGQQFAKTLEGVYSEIYQKGNS